MTDKKNNNQLLFWGITLLFPVLLLGLIEIGLRIGGYNQSGQHLFREINVKSTYLAPNPDFVGRYFTSFVPHVAADPFLKEKPENTFRIFVFGGSSTQGFPYNFYGSFSSKLQQRLLMETQGVNIEVVNLGMTAVNSYVIWDLRKRVIEYEPDAILIYAGHNEYYGSFGVGSAQFGLGKSVGLKRLILRMKNFALYQLIENIMKPEEQERDTRTMMAKVVRESSIEEGDGIYEAGIRQFEENMSDVVAFFSGNNIPVYIGTVASNLKDQAPLGSNEEALSAFNKGTELFEAGEKEAALAEFVRAKELDDTRFRAPEKINEAIREIAAKYKAVLVDVQQTAVEKSESGIPDNSFFDDHLHPDWEAHQAIADQYFDALMEHSGLKEYYLPNSLWEWHTASQFEDTFSKIPVARLTSGFPFKKGLSERQELNEFNRIYQYYRQRSYVDSLAVTAWRENQQVSVILVDVLNRMYKQADTTGVASHYLDLSYWQIFNDDLLLKGVNYLVNNREFDEYTTMLLHLILTKERDDNYFVNSLSALYLINQDLDRAGYWLEKSEEGDPNSIELMYNFARYHILKGDTLKGREYYDKYVKLAQQN